MSLQKNKFTENYNKKPNFDSWVLSTLLLYAHQESNLEPPD